MNDHMKFISWRDIKITDGFWNVWQDIGAKNTSRAIYDRFDETGRIDAMKLEWKEGMPNKPHVFWDSDIAKWMEGTAYFLFLNDDAEMRAKLEHIIDMIEKGQTEDGYFNSAYLTLRPEKRFTDRTEHELYTAGHLIEAAVAHYESTGSTRFLHMMERFADCIEKVFVKEKSASYKTPGHQELELALVRLYKVTGNKRYLELSRHFVDMRGTDPAERVFSVPNGTYPADPPLLNQLQYNDTYAQDDAPARKLKKAGGHAVRAMYFYSAMADLALEYGDEELFAACKRLWDDSVNKKMYVTGGVSAERFGEAIGTDYVLPNDLAYAETCASVAMANLSMRMFCLEQDGKYTDMIERQMYNGALSGLAMDGRSFYYDNALQVRTEVTDFFRDIHATPLYPPYERQRVFDCSCCPPNIYRFIAAMGQYFYSVKEDTVFVHQFADSTAAVTALGQTLKLVQETSYPWDENVRICLECDKPFLGKIAVRIPAWCHGAVVMRNGEKVLGKAEKGYLYMEGNWNSGDEIVLTLPMEIQQLAANPSVAEAAGKVALRRGPVVYCLEAIDNREHNLFHLILPKEETACEFHCGETEIAGQRVVTIHGTALCEKMDSWQGELYHCYAPEYITAHFTAIPYFAWANRGKSDMVVWIRKQY